MSDQTYDARGLLCPLPVLKARKLLLGMQTGDVLTITCDDVLAMVDIPHFCDEAGHSVLDISDVSGVQTYQIRHG